MDVKIITGFLLWFCFIASLSISPIESASLDSRQRFRREPDETPVDTTVTGANELTTEQLSTGKLQAAETAAAQDGSTVAPAADDATTAAAATARANAEAATTAGSETAAPTSGTNAEADAATVNAATVNAATVDAATVDGTTSGADVATSGAEAEGAAATTAAEAEGTAATTAAEAEGSAATTAAEAEGAAATTAAETEADAATTAAESEGDAATTAADGDGDASTDGANTEATTSGADTEADAGTTAAEAETTAAGADTTADDDATTAADDNDATTDTAATTEEGEAPKTEAVQQSDTTDATTAEVVTENSSSGEGATSDGDTETSTSHVTDAVTDDETSAKPENGHGDDDEGSTTGASDGTTSADGTTTDSNTATTFVDTDTTDGASDATTALSSDSSLTTTGDVASTDGSSIQTTVVEEVTTVAPSESEPSGRVELRVVISPEILQVQRGESYEITCTVYGADASTTIYWIQEEPERRYALIDEANANDKQVTMSQVSLKARITLDDPSKIGKYTCMAQDTAGNSGAAILTMEEGSPYYPRPPIYPPVVPPSGGQGYLRIVAPDMAEGDYVEIQCEGAAPDDEGRIQWFFNNRLLSDEQPLYPRGKTLHIRPISRPYLGNYRCSIPGSSYADANSVLTFGGPVPSPTGPIYPSTFTATIDFVQGQTTTGHAQENSQVILRCQTNEPTAKYQWTYASSQGPVNRGNTDQFVLPRPTVQDSGVYTCEATNNRGQSASAFINLYVTASPQQPVTGRCSIDEATCRNGRCIPRAYLYDGKNDCGDNSDEAAPSGGADACQPNEIRCTNGDRGRKCVQKFWMCDGDRDCDDGSDEEQRYCELLPRQRYCKPSEFHCGSSNATTPNPICIPRSFQCDGYNDCPDRSDEQGCVKPIVVSAPQRQIQINAGQTLTIQCTARGSPAPYINWRLNWGHVCGDGSDNGRCTMAQAVDANEPGLVIGTLTVRNANVADGGAYSCEALNNQGFIFAIPDAIVDVIIDSGRRPPTPPPCNCNGHSSSCSPDGQCLNCQHNTAGSNCEFCATGYQGDARRGTPYDCQQIQITQPTSRCNPSGTHMERGGRCICKYNVDGERCDQCKRSHFYLNPTTPNGCLPCFCSGVSNECTSTEWRRQPTPLALNNWTAVPKNFATDSYEVNDQIKKRQGGRELALDQSSLGRPAKEVLYWKAPKTALGDFVTLYDGNIDVHFTNDGNENEAPSNDEFIWLRGNNIDLVHKLPPTQRFKPNTNATYSVPCNERAFTRKDGTYIDRENILMALSDLDTLLVKINPIGGRRNAVLRGVTLNTANTDGYVDAAPTVESCRCPANYTGTSCEKCAEGYGRPHPLVGIYLGQCWSCRSLCNDRSDRCDRDSGKCLDCQANSEGDRCERCRPGYILDARLNQCTQGEEYRPYPQPPYGTGSRGAYYLDQRPYDVRGTTPVTILLDGNLPEQRVPLQVLNAQPQSVVWGRTDGSPLPPNVFQDGNDLVFRSPSIEQAGHYICTITHPDGYVERIAIYLEYRPGQRQPVVPPFVYPLFSPPSPLIISEGENRLVQPQGVYYRVHWRRDIGQPLPAGVTQNGNALQISSARPEHSGTYYCDLYGNDGTHISIPYELRVQPFERPQATSVGAPKISIEPKVINLKEGQRMIVQYTVSSLDPIDVKWNKLTEQGYQPIPSLFNVEQNRLVLNRATPDAAGTYQVVVRNPHGEDRQELRINVEPRRGRLQQAGAPRVRLPQDQYEIGHGEVLDIVPVITGAAGSKSTWSKDGASYLPEGVVARNDGALLVEGRSSDVAGRYTLDVSNAYGRASTPLVIQWKEAAGQHGVHVDQNRRVQWNVQKLDLNEGRRLEAVCRSDVDPSSLRLDVTRNNGRQRESVPLGLSFSNGYLSLGAVTGQDNGLEFTCSAANISDTLTLTVHPSTYPQDGGRSYIDVRLEALDEQSHQVGRDIHLQCRVQGSIERPYEYTYTKDGLPVANNVEAHPNGLLIIRNAQDSDSGRYRCEVNFPRAPEAGTQESSFDLRVAGGAAAAAAATAGGSDRGVQYGAEYPPAGEYVEVTVEPSEATLGRGEKANLTCRVKGAQQYILTWTKYAHDTSLPNYARQQGNSVLLAPTDESSPEQMYLQCSVAVPGQSQPYSAYAPVTIRGSDELSKKKKKRRS